MVLETCGGVLGVFALGVGIWALPVWKPYDLLSMVQRVRIEDRERAVLARLQNLLKDPDSPDATLYTTALQNTAELVENAPDRNWEDLAGPFTKVLQKLLDKATLQLEDQPNIAVAAMTLKQARKLMTCDAAAILVKDPDLLLDLVKGAEIGLARAKISSGDKLEEVVPQVRRWTDAVISGTQQADVVLAVICLAHEKEKDWSSPEISETAGGPD